ncbi:Probable RNA-directed DNA polymerase from transposon X-element [Eumeta japonica]|uniref:Probable RNA-directed DNA polymerase from transposon X-element n=1 Tax=Eumeta variegata TaxID=151549 RepID=A0A4C1W8F2_EUMVA|nr:Probable RNA-directed DNA polymerase from transposon X-element [Eumeta japonica]
MRVAYEIVPCRGGPITGLEPRRSLRRTSLTGLTWLVCTRRGEACATLEPAPKKVDQRSSLNTDTPRSASLEPYAESTLDSTKAYAPVTVSSPHPKKNTSQNSVLTATPGPSRVANDTNTNINANAATTLPNTAASIGAIAQKALGYPPIVVENLPNWVVHFEELRRLIGYAPNARVFGKGIRFLPKSDVEFRTEQSYLKTAAWRDQQVTWYCYALETEKSSKVGISGLPVDTAPDAIVSALQELYFPAKYMRPIIPRKGRPGCLFYARLGHMDQDRLHKLYEVSTLLNMPRIIIEDGESVGPPPMSPLSSIRTFISQLPPPSEMYTLRENRLPQRRPDDALSITAAPLTSMAPGSSTAMTEPSHRDLTERAINPPNPSGLLAEEESIVEGRRRRRQRRRRKKVLRNSGCPISSCIVATKSPPRVSHTELEQNCGSRFCFSDIHAIFDNHTLTILAGDFNAKHTVWGSRVVSPMGRQLLQNTKDYGYEILCPDTPSHVPTDPRFSADVLDIVLCPRLPFPIHVEVLYDMATHHPPILITLGTTGHLTPARPHNTPPEEVDLAAKHLNYEIQTAYGTATTHLPEPNCRQWDLPPRLQRAPQHKRNLQRLWARTRSPRVKRDLKHVTQELRQEVWTFRGAAWEETIGQAGEDWKSLHQLCRRLTKAPASVWPLFDKTGMRRYAAKDRAEILAEHLEEQFTLHPASTCTQL